jgi:hypothetical protein
VASIRGLVPRSLLDPLSYAVSIRDLVPRSLLDPLNVQPVE